MIRRKIWATATCLAVAGAAQAQTGLGQRPAPVFVPRNYVAPTAPGYSALPPGPPPQAAAPVASSGVVSGPAELFAVGTDTPTAAAPAPMPMAPGAAPMAPPALGPAPMVVDPGAATPMPMAAGPMVIDGGAGAVAGSPVVEGGLPGAGPALNGGPITSAPYLDGMAGGFAGGPGPGAWATGEYLFWRVPGVKVPPLVTTAPPGAPGTLDDPATALVYGGREVLQTWQSGYRMRAGFWLPDGASGVDLGFFALMPMDERAVFVSGTGPGLFRPFFNTATRSEAAFRVGFTDPTGVPILSGGVGVLTESFLYGGEANYRTGWGTGFGGRVDALVGVRYVQLQDKLTVQSNSTVLVPAGAALPGTPIGITDRFESVNQFLGGQVGFVGEWLVGGMTFGLRGTVAVGGVDQRVEISGLTVGNGEAFPGGLLALTPNEGIHTRRRVSVLSEVGATLGYQVSNNIRIFGGYNLLYWTNVARAGAQVSRNVNATFIPDPTTGVATPSGAPAPWFHHRDENLYLQGWTGGVELRW